MPVINVLVTLILNALAVFVTDYILSGVSLDSFKTSIIVAVVLGIVNTFLRPILNLLALPINILSLGLFSLVINALLVLLVAFLVEGFNVDGFLWALAFSLVLSIVNTFLSTLKG